MPLKTPRLTELGAVESTRKKNPTLGVGDDHVTTLHFGSFGSRVMKEVRAAKARLVRWSMTQSLMWRTSSVGCG